MQKLKQWSIFSFLLLIFLASSWSLLVTPQFFRVHDFTHAGRIAEMAQALQDGHFPVRWTENFGYGYGMPLFEFYGPLPFYIGSAVYLLFGNIIWSIKFLYLLSNFGTLLGGYTLGKQLFGKIGGVLVAAFLTLAPYRAMNLFARGALNEMWGVLFLPWILLGLIQIFHQYKYGWSIFVFSLMGLFLSHNITTMIFLPLLGIFALGYGSWMYFTQSPEFFRKGRFRGKNFLRIISQIGGSGILALTASSFYLTPAFLEKSLTQVESIILTPYFNYQLHFLYIRQFFNPKWGYGGSSWGVDDGISFFLGWGQLFTLALLFFVAIRFFWKHFIQNRKKGTSFLQLFGLEILFGFLLGIPLFMSLLKSQFLWDQIALFKFIQFPWRWLSIAILFLSLLLAGITTFIEKKILRVWLSGLLVVITVFGAAPYFQPEKYLDDPNSFYYTDSFRIRKDLSSILPDYISADMKTLPTVIPSSLVLNAVEDEKYEILADRVHEKLLKTSFSEPTLMSFSIATYPGWRVEIDGQWWNKGKGTEGNIEIEVPAGEHLVSIRFENTPIRYWSDWVSFFSWGLLFYLLLPSYSHKRETFQN